MSSVVVSITSALVVLLLTQRLNIATLDTSITAPYTHACCKSTLPWRQYYNIPACG
jgi:hypothetical protein